MSHTPNLLSRRDFLKLAGLGLGALALNPFRRVLPLPEFPAAERLGRNCTGGKIDIKTRPDSGSATIKSIYEDTLLPWLREVTADNRDTNRLIQRWVETPEGYVYAPFLQPVRYQPNQPLTALPEGVTGFWAEVSVPYVDIYLDNPPPRSPSLRHLLGSSLPVRLYYSQVMWIDQIKTGDSGQVAYRVNERYGSYGDIFWADAAAFRPLTGDEIAPISPEMDPAEKSITVNVTNQTLSCFEGSREVYYCRVSTGMRGLETPLGEFSLWRKTISVRMAVGTQEAGYDTPGVSWVTYFVGTGVAIHATYWHNEYGFARSHGCVNCKPEDAKWIFRWTMPFVPLEPGDVTWTDWRSGSTRVKVEQRFW
ncbi:MAG: L,D-transpeptidase [Anaerolineales bacterium]|nr:L,D-transpeptidase [Anaerolineales bacterium]